MVFGFCVFFCIWEPTLMICFNTFRQKIEKSKKYEIFVVRTILLRCFGIVGPKWSPYGAEPLRYDTLTVTSLKYIFKWLL